MRRQQTFLASMVRTAVSRDMLTHPVRLYRIVDAATRSLTTDPGLGDLASLLDWPGRYSTSAWTGCSS
jgi:anionic cell wall polymer biosynthesis LytR-Cps2A-Psr (LCP) family protein